jgi:hypothetical protein
VPEEKVLMRIFGSNREEVRGRCMIDVVGVIRVKKNEIGKSYHISCIFGR